MWLQEFLLQWKEKWLQGLPCPIKIMTDPKLFTLKWKDSHVDYQLLAALKVVVMTTLSAASDYKVVNMGPEQKV